MALVLLSGCGSTAIRYQPSLTALGRRPAIIFVPGFYGSALDESDSGERVFLTAWAATFSQTPLAVTRPDLGVVGARNLTATGVLQSIPVIPGLYSQNVYGEALDFLQEKFAGLAEIVPFHYDWRQDIAETAGELGQLVKGLEARGAFPLLIVGHSMGGLVTAYYLRYGAQDPLEAVDTGEGERHISAALIAGAPFGGAPGAFRNLQIGASLGAATTPLGAESLGTFASMYQLIPGPDGDTYLNAEGKNVGTKMFQPEIWQKQKWGLFLPRGSVTPEFQAKREAFVTHQLRRGEKLMEKIRAEGVPALGKPSVLYFVGSGTPTLARVLWNQPALEVPGQWLFDGEEVKKAFPEKNLPSLMGDGDDTVTVSSARPPDGLLRRLPGKIVTAPAKHEAMFGNKEFLKIAEAFLTEHLRAR